MNIFLTALATLVVTVVAGLILEYWRNSKPKIVLKVREALPIEVDGKKIGAYQVDITNTSKKTIKDLSVHIEAKVSTLKNGGVTCPQGFVHEININEGKMKIDIPFFKEKEELSLTVIAESQYYLPTKPDVAVRSPNQFKLIDFKDFEKKRTSFLGSLSAPLVASITATIMALSVTTFEILPKSQKDILAFAASTSGLPELVKLYATSDDIKYFNQGDLAYAFAEESGDRNKIVKYKHFLETTISLGSNMMNKSKCNTLYNLGKICLLLNEIDTAKKYFIESISINDKHVGELIKYDEKARLFINNNALIHK